MSIIMWFKLILYQFTLAPFVNIDIIYLSKGQSSLLNSKTDLRKKKQTFYKRYQVLKGETFIINTLVQD